MLNSNYIESLFGIKGAKLKNIERNTEESTINVYFELEKDIHECPACKELTISVHDYRVQKIKGPPLGEYFMVFHYRKRDMYVLLVISGFMRRTLLSQGITVCHTAYFLIF